MAPPKPKTYAEQIALLAVEYLSPNFIVGNMSALANALGCRTLIQIGDSWRPTHPRQPDAADEDLVVDTLTKALRHNRNLVFSSSEDNHASLDGLAKNNRWRKCLDNKEDTYALAISLIELAVDQRNKLVYGRPTDLFDAMGPDIANVLNTWRATDDIWTCVPSADAMMRYFFSDVWCDLYLSDQTLTPFEVTKIVKLELPPFLPGIMNIEFETVEAMLPDLDLS
jgi:hypothetical protein